MILNQERSVLLSLATILAMTTGCSLTTLQTSPCTSDQACVTAFGAGAVCGSDGYCAAGEGDTDTDTDTDTDSDTDDTDTDMPVGYGNVVMNEILAGNDSVIADEDGQYDDWIELYNTEDTFVDLSGWRLIDDDPDFGGAWPIPEGTAIAANGYLLIWCDGTPAGSGTLHADFSVSKGGEPLHLFTPDGEVVDTVQLPAQTDDISWARNPDGTGEFSACSPTPGSENPETSCD